MRSVSSSVSSLSVLTLTILLFVFMIGGDNAPSEKKERAWKDSVSYQRPENPAVNVRVTHAIDRIRGRLLPITWRNGEPPIWVIVWKDPTLEPSDPNLLAGYIITDTLWAAKALKLFDPHKSQDMEMGMQRLGWHGNGLHDILFHPINQILHRPADEDTVHGFSLGRFPVADKIVDLRVLRQKWDAEFEIGHPTLFAEHAVYQALYDFWHGRRELAYRRILDVINVERPTHSDDQIFGDGQRGILVDYVNREHWEALRRGEQATCRHCTFKLGVLLYAIRLFGLENEVGPHLETLKARLWDAQIASGGLAHFIDIGPGGEIITIGLEPTGEASAIAVLSEVVVPKINP